MERIWRHESLLVPQKHPKRARLWFADGFWIRRRADYPHPGWSYDCGRARTQDGRPLKRGCWSSVHTPRECLAITVRRHLTPQDVQEVLYELVLLRGCPNA